MTPDDAVAVFPVPEASVTVVPEGGAWQSNTVIPNEIMLRVIPTRDCPGTGERAGAIFSPAVA